MPTPTAVLDQKCEAMLAERELYSERLPGSRRRAVIRDDAGRQLFVVSTSIHPEDLSAIISYGSVEYRRGQAAGVEGMKIAICNLIGAARETAS